MRVPAEVRRGADVPITIHPESEEAERVAAMLLRPELLVWNYGSANAQLARGERRPFATQQK